MTLDSIDWGVALQAAGVEVAKKILLRGLLLTEGIQEVGGANRGRAVERMLKRVGAKAGDPWCAAYVSDCGKTMLEGQWKLPMTASCDVLLEFARKHNALTDEPEPGAVFLVMKSPNDAIHTGFVTDVNRELYSTMEGNTNTEGGREGIGVYRRQRTLAPGRYKFIRWWAL